MGYKKIDLKLTSEIIDKKDFPVTLKGYKVEDVDIFLEQIVNDYVKFENILLEKNDALKDANNKIQQLQLDLDNERLNSQNLTKRCIDLQDMISRNASIIKSLHNSDNLDESIEKAK